MAVLSADSTAVSRSRGFTRRVKVLNGVASETYYKGATVSWLAAGKITPVHASGLTFAGIVAEASDGAIGTSDYVDIWIDGEFLIAFTNAAQTDEGTGLYVDRSAASDNPADLVPLAGTPEQAQDYLMGNVLEFVSSTLGCWVRLKSGGPAVLAP
jgi:hypothetical protein